MSSIAKEMATDLESATFYIDYGVPELNELFKTLDKETKKQLTKFPKEVQSKILENMNDKELNNYYNSLNENERIGYDNLGLRDKYRFLRVALNDKKKKEANKIEQTIPQKEALKVDKPKSIQQLRTFVETQGKIQTEQKNEQTVDQEEINNEMFMKTTLNKMEAEEIDEPLPRRFDKLVSRYYDANPYSYSSSNSELEVKFGTKGIKTITRNDFDNVIKTLKSYGFNTSNSVGSYYLRVNSEFLDSISGKFKMSDIRTEITGIHNVEEYCKNNDIKSIYVKEPTSIEFISKKPVFTGDRKRVLPVDFDDFNFRVAYQVEEKPKTGIKNFIMDNWKKSRKEFRYINRVTFTHPDYPVMVDLSIVKYGKRGADRRGREGYGNIIPVYTTEESNVFNNPETYDIEIEVNNKLIGPSTKFNNPEAITESLRKVIKYVLIGMQQTKFPVPYSEQRQILNSYMKMIWENDYDSNKYISSKNFIGPNSITLQMDNISDIDENTSVANIRKDFVVTDKADGERHLLYITNEGKIYLINTNMDVKFTGAFTNNKECFDALLDGELITNDKKGKFINLFATFDIYYYRKNDVRNMTFMLQKEELNVYNSRYYLMKNVVNNLKPVSVLNPEKEISNNNLSEVAKLLKKKSALSSPIRVICKEFYPTNNKNSIFSGCSEILKKEKEGRFEYETDGMIFTHAYYGVGSNEIKKSGPKTKITWEYSFKWKPPQYNTIDFLVTTLKEPDGTDVVKPIYEDGLNAKQTVQFNEYKTIELRCGFSEKKDGYVNPCQNIIDDNLPEYKQRNDDGQDNDYLPKRFYPTEPYDPNAGLCKIILRIDDAGVRQMFTESNETFSDNTIVEFRYDLDAEEGWRWIPLRVRHDKTSKFRRGEKEYGNSYKVCNENWKSIHPIGRITEEMISTGLGIPDNTVSEDKYYNTPAGKMKTEALKNFHNLYVKKMLIKGASKQGDTLIDYACGKAGDLPKWISSRLSFVFGIDYSKDNLENRLDGACARYLNSKKNNKNMPYALFVNGNSAFNIKNGSAMLNEKAKQITLALFGQGPKEPEKIGKGVARQYGRGDEGFNISSCQFALHYFLENPDTLKGFMRNLAECTKLNGYFIGTAYDGKQIFKELKNVKTGESVQIVEDGKKVWEIIKGYNSDTFDDNSSSIGYRIDVYQESINQLISEYLINFDYLDRVLSAYGFRLVNRESAKDMGLPESSGLFSELYMNMIEKISKNKFKANDYGDAPNMTSYEKKISFLNRYFVYEKFMEVNINNVNLDLEDYQQTEIIRNNIETKQAIEVAKETVMQNKPKVRKLTKKLMLIAATEAVDEKPQLPVSVQPKKNIKPKVSKASKPLEPKPLEPKKAKMLIIDESDEE